MTRPCPTLTIKALALTCSEVMSSEKSHVTEALAKVNASASAICSAILNSCSAQIESGGAVASWLVRSTPERAVRVRALAGDIVLCS